MLSVTVSRAGTITTPQILSKTAAATFACMQWSPIGLCFWLDCSLFGCNVRSTLKIGHYNPDLACIIQCAVQRCHHSVGENPTRQGSFQPVAIGTIVEVTKQLKLSM